MLCIPDPKPLGRIRTGDALQAPEKSDLRQENFKIVYPSLYLRSSAFRHLRTKKRHFWNVVLGLRVSDGGSPSSTSMLWMELMSLSASAAVCERFSGPCTRHHLCDLLLLLLHNLNQQLLFQAGLLLLLEH